MSSENNILFSCNYKTIYETEQIVKEHALVYVLSGTLEFAFVERNLTLEAGDIALVKRNQLAKTIKTPSEQCEFKSITIFINQALLRHYALEHNVKEYNRYQGNSIIHLKSNRFIKSYFASLEPYLDHLEKLTDNLSAIKRTEAIELLIEQGLEPLLFDFNEPYKIDLEKFMLENFKFNIPIEEFARLTGRSLSSFKRDFKKNFDTTPQRWLTAKRLDEAYYLIIKMKKRPSDIYYQLGFENFSHFSNAFKQRFGTNASLLKTD
ncbi:MAG: helix-turn-helix domain-containing protein [Bacteroidales bacterium]